MMTKFSFVFAIAVCFCSYKCNAQIQKGNVLVGGDISNFDVHFGEASSFTVQIDPKAAWFIRDNTALGAYVNLLLETHKGKGTDFSYGTGILARQYLSGNAISAVRHSRIFFEGNIGIEGENASKSSTNESTNGLGLGIGPGVAYFITPNIALEGLIMYKGIVGFGTRAATSNLNLNVGFQIYLPVVAVRRAATNIQ